MRKKKAKKMTDERVDVCGVRVSVKSRARVLSDLGGVLTSKKRGGMVFVTTPNPEQIVQAKRDNKFREVLNSSSVAVADGVGVVMAAKILGVRSPHFAEASRGRKKRGASVMERFSGRGLAEELIEVCRENHLRVMIVGGREGIAEAAAGKIQETTNPTSPSLSAGKARLRGAGKKQTRNNSQLTTFKVVGLMGARDISRETNEEKERVLGEIGKFKPDLLLVAYGAPRQEKWVWANREELEKTGVRVAMVVGGAVDVWSGRVKVAPGVVRRAGFEWLWRLVVEPWRWRRQLRLIRFGWMVVQGVL